MFSNTKNSRRIAGTLGSLAITSFLFAFAILPASAPFINSGVMA